MAKFKMTREFYVPTDAVKVEREGLTGAEAYKYDFGDKPCAMMFIGKQAKPAMHHTYSTVEKRDAAIEKFFDDQAQVAENKANREAAAKARRIAAAEGAKVGDIYYTSWGYDQTNVDFYQIVAKKGVTFQVQQIGTKIVQEGRGSDGVIADPAVKCGELMTKRMDASGGFTMSSFEYASAWDGNPKHQTSYGYGH
jgi:hypothetical protein